MRLKKLRKIKDRLVVALSLFFLLIFIRISIIHLADIFIIIVILLNWKMLVSKHKTLVRMYLFISVLFISFDTFSILLFNAHKPFWSYHFIRYVGWMFLGVIVFDYSSRYEKFLSNDIFIWLTLFFIIAAYLLYLDYFHPNQFPSVLFEYRRTSFFSDDNLIVYDPFDLTTHQALRKTGLYASHLETGFVFFMFFVLFFTLFKVNVFIKIKKTIIIILLVVTTIMLFLSVARTCIIGLLCFLIVIHILQRKYIQLSIGIMIIIIFVAVYDEMTSTMKYSNIEIVAQSADMMILAKGAFFFMSGERSSSFRNTLSQIVIPNDITTMLIGNGWKAYSRVNSGNLSAQTDIGYLQFLNGVGVIGIILLLAAYIGLPFYYIVKNEMRVFDNNNLIVQVYIAILCVYLVIEVKGMFFIGFRFGDFIGLLTGIVIAYSSYYGTWRDRECHNSGLITYRSRFKNNF